MLSRGLKLTLLIALLASANISASDNGLSVMDFLNIGVSARNAGTGEALVSLSDGAVASYYNPAGLTMADNYQIAVMHSEWYQDLRYEYLGLAMPTGQNGNLGVSFSYLGFGDINGYSSSNTPTGNIDAFDWSLGAAYGHKITERVSLGLGTKVINERLDDVATYGYAADIGAQYRSNHIGLGLGLRNLGPDVKYDQVSSPLPSTAQAEAAYWPWGDQFAIVTCVGAPFKGDISFKAGIEYAYAGALIVRSGFDSEAQSAGQDGFSMGAGIKISNHSLDYAYNANSVLGGTHQISFVLRLGKPRESIHYSNVEAPSFSNQVRSEMVAAKETSQENPSPVTPPTPVMPPAQATEQPTAQTAATPATSEAEAPVMPAADAPIAQTINKSAAQGPKEPVTQMPAKPAAIVEGKPASRIIAKPIYMVCAGRYGSRADAEKYLGALEKFGYSPRIEMVGQNDFRVVLAKESSRSTAEKKLKEYKEKGISCFIEEK